ncbi:carboxynorspermidine decarboxylase [Aquirufa regiilacus]|uniref:Carboxynorspermidine/carboxyspermidine decarboxylase n=1 Tax=Aquirufa regiilacus TaxID=3024868 RepID=A0ABU3TQY8_9BACT|nr:MULTISPECIES: carboxynorspermidine decarboxylase [unclassified Aquirufa]MDT8886796.1 carboxynorspermidine decarboxylase [Aquirufa sp. LEPPI-3A]MDU0808239.1 carboxynorspermidine decarboxylase [Aquirufa sp. LEOWEIH-7C]
MQLFPEISSPAYVLEENLLLNNLKLLQRVQQEAGVEIICALKGFSFYHVFPTVKQYLSGATASSLHEARLAFEEMGNKCHAYTPAYLPAEFEEFMSYASHMTFNSLNQVAQFASQATSKGISCGIRINPEYAEVETDMYNPCIAGSRLGIRRSDLGDRLPEGIEGLHSHTLCENDSYVLERTLAVIDAKFGDLLQQAKWLNLGGGHLITRADYQVDHLIQVLKTFKAKYPHLSIILEPGSAVGWQTGFLKSTVLDIVHSAGIDVAILDVSFAAHMPDTLEMPYKPRIRSASSEPESGKPTYRFGGMTCLAGDFYGDYSFDKPLEIGDSIIFEDMIHYTMVKTTTFNGVNLPDIGMIKSDGEYHRFKHFGYESFKDRL